jgi:hypothetical protein
MNHDFYGVGMWHFRNCNKHNSCWEPIKWKRNIYDQTVNSSNSEYQRYRRWYIPQAPQNEWPTLKKNSFYNHQLAVEILTSSTFSWTTFSGLCNSELNYVTINPSYALLEGVQPTTRPIQACSNTKKYSDICTDRRGRVINTLKPKLV